MANNYSRYEGILDKADLDKIQAPQEVFYALVKPLNESELYPFTDKQWVTAEFMNDFFVEDHNFEVIRKLMTLNSEEYCLVTHPYPYSNPVYYKLPNTVDIDYLRELMSDEAERYADWAFLSISNTWAALSFYDGDEFFVGYQQNFNPCLVGSIKSNPDFVKFL